MGIGVSNESTAGSSRSAQPRERPKCDQKLQRFSSSSRRTRSGVKPGTSVIGSKLVAAFNYQSRSGIAARKVAGGRSVKAIRREDKAKRASVTARAAMASLHDAL